MHHQNIPTSIRSFSIRKNRNNAIARENSHLIARIIISVLAGAPISEDALSQGFSQQPSQSEVLADESRQRRESKLAARVGKTYTAMFGQRHCNTTYSIPILPTPNFRGTQRYTSPHPISFVIDGVVAEPPNAIFKYFKITLQDGAIGYIDTIMFSAEDIAVANQIQIKTGCIFQGSLETVTQKIASADKAEREAAIEDQEFRERRLAFLAQRRAEEAGERAARQALREELLRRPSPRIGMSTKEVVEESSWGEPKSRNSTLTTHRFSEQWVYEGNRYLYFENGRLKVIQYGN